MQILTHKYSTVGSIILGVNPTSLVCLQNYNWWLDLLDNARNEFHELTALY